MVGQGTRSPLFRTMSDVEFQGKMEAQFVELLSSLKESYFKFRKGAITPESTHAFECGIETNVREFARSFMHWCLGSLESETPAAMPPTIFYGDEFYRRLPDKTRHSRILTLFGDITLQRTMFRRGSRGKVISPLEKALGIECRPTPRARGFIGRQVAAAGASQERCAEAVAERTGTRIGHEKLRNISALLAESMEPHREVCQLA